VSTTRRGKYAALALGIALVAGACSSDNKGGSTSPTGGTQATTAPTTGGSTPSTESTGSSTPAPTGGTVTYAAEQEYTAYNNATADQVLFANTLELNLIQPSTYISEPDLTYKLDENLMQSVEVTSKDPQVIVYKVQPKAVWQDGEPIDCDDFYLAWMSQNGAAGNKKDASGNDVKDDEGNPVPIFNAAGTFGYEDISKVECSADGKTITMTYSKPFADYQNLFGNLMPAHIVEKIAGVADLTKATDPADIAKLGDAWSTGFSGFDATRDLSGLAYKIDSFTPGETMILSRNEAYYGPPGGPDEIVFRQVPSADDQPAALGNGDVQVISPQPNPDLLSQVKGLSGVTSEVDQGVTFEHIDFNQANPILADLAVRQAIALCINRDEIVDTLVKPLNPDATVLNNRIYIPSQPDYKDNSGAYAKQDIAGAKAKLEGAGWALGSDGIYAKNGQRLSLRLGRRDPNPRRQSTNELMATECKAAGIELTDDPSEDFNSVRLPASDYDIALFAWVATAALSSNTSIYQPGGGQNWNNYNNPKIQTLFDQANIELDPAKRADLMNQIDQTIWDDMATVPLFQFQEMVAHSDAIGNVVYNGPLGVTWNAQEWTVAA